MIAKEWRDARWKFLTAAAVIVLLVVTLLPPYEYEVWLEGTLVGNPLGVRWEAGFTMWQFYNASGSAVIIPLAALLGAGLVSGEVSGGSIFLLLSRPVSRTRLLLTKYGVCAGVLLAAALLGAVLLVLLAAAVRGYPVASVVSFPGIALSAVLMWLGSLSVLGVALLASILFRGILASLVATALALFLILIIMPGYLDSLISNWQDHPRLFENVHLHSYWFSQFVWYMDMGRSSVRSVCGQVDVGMVFECPPFVSIPTHFLVSTIAAAVPLLAALWLFNRKAY